MKLHVKISFISLIAVTFLILSSCNEAKFNIKGEIAGGQNHSLVLEKPDFQGRWIPIDSTRISSNGHFSMTMDAPPAPEIYRLSLDNKYIYFPIDSTETIKLNTSLQNFGHEFTLSGSDKAKAMENFEKDVMLIEANIMPDSLDKIKKQFFTKYMHLHPGSILAYYVLTKVVNDKPLFDPFNDTDYKYFAAVATGFKSVRPDDPHTALLEKTSLDAMRRRNSMQGKHIEVEADEISLIDITLNDENGTPQRLYDVVGKGKKTVVIFSLLNMEDSPLLNIELNKIYTQNKGSVEFYNVSLDQDQYEWREAAKNLPWITVYDPDGQYSETAAKYNLSILPTFFIYDVKGDLTASTVSIDELKTKLHN